MREPADLGSLRRRGVRLFLGFFRFGRAEQVKGVEWRAVRQEQGRQDERDEAEPEASHRHVR